MLSKCYGIRPYNLNEPHQKQLTESIWEQARCGEDTHFFTNEKDASVGSLSPNYLLENAGCRGDGSGGLSVYQEDVNPTF